MVRDVFLRAALPRNADWPRPGIEKAILRPQGGVSAAPVRVPGLLAPQERDALPNPLRRRDHPALGDGVDVARRCGPSRAGQRGGAVSSPGEAQLGERFEQVNAHPMTSGAREVRMGQEVRKGVPCCTTLA